MTSRPKRPQSSSTDQYGRFLIKGVAPGGYKLFAWEDIIDGQYENPEFMKSYEALGQSVAIRELSHDSAQLNMICERSDRLAKRSLEGCMIRTT